MEQSGHPLRLGNVTNTRGLEGTLTRLVLYYPNWCLMQTIMAQDTKHLDLFYGRVQLSSMTQTEVDKIVDEYVGILDKLIENINPNLSFSAASIYEHVAAVIPQLLARLVYKCSLDMLDAVLGVALKICRSNVKRKFIGMKQLIKVSSILSLCRNRWNGWIKFCYSPWRQIEFMIMRIQYRRLGYPSRKLN